MPSVWSSAKYNLLSVIPSHFFPLTLWINHITQGIVAVGQICIALDLFSFKYSFIKHEVRLLLSFRGKLGLVFAPQKPQPVREVNT